MELNDIIITKEKNWYVAKNKANNIASQGKSKVEALNNLEEAIELYENEE